MHQYLDSEGKRHPVYSQDVNSYLQEITGGDYTAKDFRTWGGTVGAIELFQDALNEIELSPKRNLAVCLVRKVADKLGNTMAVCKAYYIHPTILLLAEQNRIDLEKLLQIATKKYASLASDLSEAELIALHLIENTSDDLESLLSASLKVTAAS